MNKYDNIDFCLNTLYDYLYNETTKNCYILKNINPKKIKIEDLVMIKILIVV